MVVLDRLLSYGQSDTIPDWLARRLRVTNALAALGIALTLSGMPIDVMGGPLSTIVLDIACITMFASCWFLNAKGYRTASRVILMFCSNAVITGGLVEFGGYAELRTVFFPLVLMSFFVFDVSERRWLALFTMLAVAEYFVTSYVAATPRGVALEINLIYAPVLAFTMIIAGSAVFAYIERSSQKKLQRTQAAAAQSSRLAALGEMSSGIAHEIRNPLAAIHIAASQIADHPSDAVLVADLGERIQRIVMRASRIIEGLRTFSRDASGDPFIAAPVDRIISDTLELCGKRLADNGVDLQIDTVPPELTVECRQIQISQVLMNLLGNAYDALPSTDSERWVRVEVRTEADTLVLAVSNSGPTIPSDLRSRIFEPFFTTKEVDRGTGLGLSLSRGIIEAHRGTLKLDDTSPVTRFVIRLPVTQPALPAVA